MSWSQAWNTWKFAVRSARKSPSLSITIIATLALGIGANTAVFSAIDAILLRPLPFPNGDRLMTLAQYNPKGKNPANVVAPVRLEDWSRMNSTFQAMTGYYTEDVSETSGPLPEKVTRAWVTKRFFQVWGVAPALGRDFSPEEERSGNPDVVVLSDRFWRRRFGADPHAIGKRLRVEGYAYTIVGVMPPMFLFPERGVDLWTRGMAPASLAQNRELTWYTVVGRLKPGVTLAQARADLATVQAQLGKQFPKTDAELAVKIDPLKEVTIGGIRRSLWILFGSVTLLLLLACSNIASLLLAHTTQRTQEIAIRFSLGASRAAVTMQLLAEAFVLALAGSLAGLLVAAGASNVFHALAKNLPRADEIQLDWRILAYSLVCAAGVTIVSGLMPALRATGRNTSRGLAQSSRTQVSGRSPMQWALVSTQIALAVTLLAGAGLLLRSFQALGRVSPGFDPSHVLMLSISGNYGETNDMKALTQRIDRTLDALRSVPGVEAAATSASVPGMRFELHSELKVSGLSAGAGRKITAAPRYVSPGYFAALHVPVLAGEPFRGSLCANTVVVNRSFADTYLATGSMIGRTIEPAQRGIYDPAPAMIRGIVADAREQGLNHDPEPTVYWCSSAPNPTPIFLVRTYGEPLAMAETLRRKIHEIEPGRAVYDVAPLVQRLDDTFAENRLRTILLTSFAVTAVALACVGLYGTLSYFVNVRRREVGLRLALGALRGQIIGQFLVYGLRASLAGCAAGMGLAAAFSRVLSGLLFGVSAWDVPTFVAVFLVVLATGGLAALLPSMRAARVEPMEVLREQ